MQIQRIKILKLGRLNEVTIKYIKTTHNVPSFLNAMCTDVPYQAFVEKQYLMKAAPKLWLRLLKY